MYNFYPREVAVTQNVNSQLLKAWILFCILSCFPLKWHCKKNIFESSFQCFSILCASSVGFLSKNNYLPWYLHALHSVYFKYFLHTKKWQYIFKKIHLWSLVAIFCFQRSVNKNCIKLNKVVRVFFLFLLAIIQKYWHQYLYIYVKYLNNFDFREQVHSNI